jgi:hypothetical protein
VPHPAALKSEGLAITIPQRATSEIGGVMKKNVFFPMNLLIP